MKAIIFSKDRACQLHCLLESMKENMWFFNEVEVIYKTKFYESYTLLKEDWPDVKWTEQHIFKDDFFSALYDGYNCLLVDDDIVFKKVHDTTIIEAMSEADIFSIRLGNNIQHRKHFEVKSSVDGNFFKAETLRKLKDDWFTNPNQLEIKLHKHTKNLTMAWGHESKLIGIPNNRVSPTSKCAHMGGDANELDNLYLAGYRIQWKEMDLDHYNVHREEPYILRCLLNTTT